MQLEPGPIPAITSDWYDQSQTDYGLAQFTSDQLAELDDVESDLDSFIDPGFVFSDELEDDGLGPVLDAADSAIADVGAIGNDWPIAETDQAFSDAGEELENVFHIVPGEAFQDVPPPTTVPDSVPELDIANPVQVILTNPGQNPQASFRVGEPYTFRFKIFPSQGGGGTIAGVSITEYAWRNDVILPPVLLGVTDQFGQFVYAAVWQPGDEGHWKATFQPSTPAGPAISSLLVEWDVTPGSPSILPSTGGPGAGSGISPIQPTPAPTNVTVTLINNTPGRPSDVFSLADTWTLQVTGAPNAGVIVTAIQDGNPFPPAQVGQTNADGLFTLIGTFNDAEIGNWVETYRVAGVEWSDALRFTVQP